jgi:hypothetical protein
LIKQAFYRKTGFHFFESLLSQSPKRRHDNCGRSRNAMPDVGFVRKAALFRREDMRLAETFASATIDDVKSALDGGKLVLYSTGRPPTPDHAITRSTALATFAFASPAFEPDAEDGALTPLFLEAQALASGGGTPGFARAFKADGSVVADFSVGPGDTEIKLSGVSATIDFPIAVTSMKIASLAEKVEWRKTEYGHVYIASSDNPYRKLSVRG